MRAGCRAVPTADTLRAVGGAGYVHIHFTYPAARTAGRTLLSIYLDAVNRYPVENAIERPEGAEPFAEGAVKEYGEHNNSQQNAALPGEQPAQAGPDSGIGSGQRDTSLQDTGGTDVLAKERISHAHLVHHRHGQDDDKQDQDDVFQTGQGAEPLGTELFAGYFVQQLLEPAEGTQKAADRPPQQYAER